MAGDWFRKTTWTDHDRDDFYKHLRRARAYGQPQYLRIQAGYFTGDARTIPWALDLLDEVLTKHPDSDEVATALGQKADCLRMLGDVDGALDNYWKSIERMRVMPKMRCQAWLDFGLLTARERRRDRYDDALSVLREFAPKSPLQLPLDKFKLHASRALIARDRSSPGAQAEAMAALEAADRAHSGLRNHPRFGLVGEGFDELRAELATLATSSD